MEKKILKKGTVTVAKKRAKVSGTQSAESAKNETAVSKKEDTTAAIELSSSAKSKIGKTADAETVKPKEARFEPLISVIMPVYNAGGYLLPNMRSILDNTYENIELICIDDGSTDSSLQTLKFQSSVDPRVKVISQKNSGPAVARNTGLDNATGDYIAFVDCDDYIEHDMFEKLVDNVRKTKADIVAFGGRTFPIEIPTPDWIAYRLNSTTKVYDDDGAGLEALFRENNTNPFIWLHFIRRSIFETEPKLRFDTTFDLGEDQILIFSYFPRAKIVSFISDKLYNYRLNHTGSLMDKYNNMKVVKFETHIRMMGEVLSNWTREGYRDVSGECMTHFIMLLWPDFEKLPEYKKIRYAKQIVSVVSKAGWNICMCREFAYGYAKTIVDYSQKDDINIVDVINEKELNNKVIEDEINDVLASRAYRLGRFLTKKSKRIDEKWLTSKGESIF